VYTCESTVKIFLRESDLNSLKDDHPDKNLEGSERGSGNDVSVCRGPHVQEFLYHNR
jgi:hypothetical protein